MAEDSRACLIDCQRITWCTQPDGSRVLLGEGAFGQVRESARCACWGGVGWGTQRVHLLPASSLPCSAWLAGVARWPEYCKLKPAGSRVACLRRRTPPLPQVFKVLLDGVQPHAAKVMYLGQAAEAEEAFVREASLLKQLRHRNIVGELPPVGGACDGLTWKGGDRNAWAFKAWRGTACSLLRAAEGLTATRCVPACRPWLCRLQRCEHHGAARGHHPHGRSVLGGGRDDLREGPQMSWLYTPCRGRVNDGWDSGTFNESVNDQLLN